MKILTTKTDLKLIESTLKLIKEQLGLDLILDNYFSGISIHNKRKYFNIILPTKTSESQIFQTLIQFSNKYKLIKVEENGINRVAIYPATKFSNTLIK